METKSEEEIKTILKDKSEPHQKSQTVGKMTSDLKTAAVTISLKSLLCQVMVELITEPLFNRQRIKDIEVRQGVREGNRNSKIRLNELNYENHRDIFLGKGQWS